VGFDGLPFAALASPPLTTVRQPFERLAEHAVARLVGPSPPSPALLLEPALVARASSGPPGR
jgi:DNA-binding LacI/PurR family transcriptional regulator